MTAYLITYGADVADSFTVERFATRTSAMIAAGGSPLANRHVLVEGETNADITAKEICDIYNKLVGENEHVNRFETRSAGLRRLLAKLATTTIVPQSKDDNMTTTTTTTEPTRRGRKMKYVSPTATIKTVQANPYREGTKRHTAFALYRHGMTAADFLAAGGKTYDLNRALRDGLITVSE